LKILSHILRFHLSQEWSVNCVSSSKKNICRGGLVNKEVIVKNGTKKKVNYLNITPTLKTDGSLGWISCFIIKRTYMTSVI
jgi:hypothetical protein